MPTSAVIGTRDMARSRKGVMRSQSGGSSPKEKSSESPAAFRGRLGRLEQPHHQPAALYSAVITVGARILEHRHVRRKIPDRLGDQSVMLRRLIGDRDAREPTELTRPHAGAVDDDIGLDVAERGANARYVSAVVQNAGRRHAFDDFHAPRAPPWQAPS